MTLSSSVLWIGKVLLLVHAAEMLGGSPQSAKSKEVKCIDSFASFESCMISKLCLYLHSFAQEARIIQRWQIQSRLSGGLSQRSYGGPRFKYLQKP